MASVCVTLGSLADEPRIPAASLSLQSAEACLCSRSDCVLSLWALSALFRKDRTELESVAESDWLAIRPREEDEADWYASLRALVVDRLRLRLLWPRPCLSRLLTELCRGLASVRLEIRGL